MTQRSRHPLRARFTGWIQRRFLVRLHMTAILLGVVAGGTLVNVQLYAFGLHSMMWRHLAVIGCSYLFFLALVRVWIAYVRSSGSSNDSADLDVVDLFDHGGHWIDWGSQPMHGGPSLSADGGSSFGGGGATGSWGEGASSANSLSSSSSSTSSLSVPSIDLDEGGCVVLAVLAVLVAAICGTGLYLIYIAPTMLAEAAFEALLAGALARRTRKMEQKGWVGSVVGATALPLTIVLLMSVAFAAVAARICPGSTSVAQVVACASERNQ